MQSIKIETHQTTIDWIRWFFAALGVVGIIAANYYFVHFEVTLKIAANLLAVLVIFGIVSFTQKGKRFWQFARDARNELRKVVWPTKQETIHTTLLIIAVVVITALFLWAVDSVLFWAVTFITGQRG